MTLNWKINCRQADEAAPAKQKFKSPQAELEWLKANRQDLKGFVRVLEIIDEQQAEARETGTCPFIAINQGNGALNSKWLAAHHPTCEACVGALLCWFFGGSAEITKYGEWEYELGFFLLQRHLDPAALMPAPDSEIMASEMTAVPAVQELCGIMNEQAGDDYEWTEMEVFDGTDWPVPHLDVFRTLAAAHPGK